MTADTSDRFSAQDVSAHVVAAQPLQRRRVLAALAVGAASSPLAWAQSSSVASTWPNARPIRIVVAYPPGGLTDAYARLYAEQLSAQLGVTAIVDNKPGAGAILAIDHVAKSAPDGYTLLMTTSGTVWQNRVLYAKLPYNLERDLTPVVNFPSGPLVVGVPEKLPVRTMQEFIAYARKQPVSMGTYAPGSYPHMVADQLNRQSGTQIQSVHYKGEAPMWLDLAGGQTQIAIGSYQAFAAVQARGVRPLGVTGSYRSPRLPDVPTLIEQGVDPRLVGLEGGLPLMAPAGTPEPILQVLSKVAVEGANTPRAAQLRETFAIPNKPVNLDETRSEWARVVPIWVKLAVDLGIKLD
ncbi:MAG: tripartite tricarboxylate transporter substrate binding protein [Betaproteobacteria bacterium]|nr:tripartite tricarboxylate transporter substrate binding protein [Betaproteobacteria bacterium]